MNFNEGMKIILLLKLNNYLFEKNIIDNNKAKGYFNVCIDIGKIFYYPENIFSFIYILKKLKNFLKQLEKLMKMIII